LTSGDNGETIAQRWLCSYHLGLVQWEETLLAGPGADLINDRLVELRERIVEMYHEVVRCAALASNQGDISGAASAFVTSSQEMNTWADVWEKFGGILPLAMEATTKDVTDPGRWRAVLDTDDPLTVNKAAAYLGLSKTQIRNKYGSGNKYARPRTLYSGTGTVNECNAGTLKAHVDIDALEEVKLPTKVTMVIKEARK